MGEDCGSGVAQSGLEGSGVLTRVDSAEDVNTAFSLVVMIVEDGMGSSLDKFGGGTGSRREPSDLANSATRCDVRGVKV